MDHRKTARGTDRYFGSTKAGSTPRRELTAGLATFFSTACILFVTPQILSQAGMERGAVYGIYYGIAFGSITYCIVKICRGKAREIQPILWISTGLFILNCILLAIL